MMSLYNEYDDDEYLNVNYKVNEIKVNNKIIKRKEKK